MASSRATACLTPRAQDQILRAMLKPAHRTKLKVRVHEPDPSQPGLPNSTLRFCLTYILKSTYPCRDIDKSKPRCAGHSCASEEMDDTSHRPSFSSERDAINPRGFIRLGGVLLPGMPVTAFTPSSEYFDHFLMNDWHQLRDNHAEK